MQRFCCPSCAAVVSFGAQGCRDCGARLGYLPEGRTIVEMQPTARPGTFTLDGDPTERWRCLNAAWGCNWILVAGEGTEWCASCRLTHGRPDDGYSAAVEAWSATEAAKRRVVHQLCTLGLPVEGRSAAHPRGLVFELVHVPGEPAVTGHLTGVVTIDLTEADDVHREQLRQQFGEGTRTMLGHLRHEMGHYYWPLLVVAADRLQEFRTLFGDERIDYGPALEDHRWAGRRDWNRDEHISAYASAHPAEDWAETFAHHMLISDATETAQAHRLATDLGAEPSFIDRARSWQDTAASLDCVAASLGMAPLYPFDLTPRVLDKLSFVDRCIQAHARLRRPRTPDPAGRVRRSSVDVGAPE